MNKKKLFIIVSILAAIGLVVMLFMLPKPKTNNTAKHETSTEISSSKESSKKNDDKKNQTSKKDDKKKDDTGKKEDKKEDTSTTSETPVTPTTGTTTPENNNSSLVNTPSTNTTPSQPEPQPIYQTIHHEEVGHWETQVIQEAWDEPTYEIKIIGNNTGKYYSSVDEFGEYGVDNGDYGYHTAQVQTGTIHHDAVTQQDWVVDQYAWDETVYERKIIGNNTGTIYNSVSEWGDNANGDEGYHVGDVQVGTTHHDAVTQQVWVVDQYAWDETVIVGYR